MKINDIRRIDIDGGKIKTANDFHGVINEITEIGGYGRNLDALYDALTASTDLIVIHRADLLKKNLGAYAEKIFKIFNNASEYSGTFAVIFK